VFFGVFASMSAVDMFFSVDVLSRHGLQFCVCVCVFVCVTVCSVCL